MSRTRSLAVLVACALVASLLAAFAEPARAQQIDAKKAQAAALEHKIAAQGQALSIADEQYNASRIKRQQIQAQASSAKDLVLAAGRRWQMLRSRLSTRVRLLYMHPGAAIDAWLSVKSLDDLERARKLGESVLTADTNLVTQTERAREEVMARAKTLDDLQNEARAKEVELASARAQVGTSLSAERALLGTVKGQIAALIEADRQRQIEQAKKTIPAPGSGSGDTPGGSQTIDATPVGPPPPVAAGASTAVAAARAQIGKPYQWAAAGPDSFDCSGLTMYAWAAAGVSMVHSAAAQFDEFPHVAKSQLAAGDLVFFGNPIHHVGIYEGGGIMIDAPQTGENVRRDSIYRDDYVGASRP